MALVAIVLTSWFSQPSNEITRPEDPQTENRQEAYGPNEGHWWPEFSARDTYAQWIVAVFSVVAVWWVKRTFDETRRIGQAQVRAYVQLDDIRAVYSKEGGTGTNVRVFVDWKNTGQSPTRKLVWAIDHRIGQIGDDFDFALSSATTKGKTSIGVGQTTGDISHEIARGSATTEFDRGKSPITVFGYVEYNDIFFPGSERHRTEFCIQIWRGKGVNIDNYTSDRYNGADDDCMFPPTA